MIKIVNLIFCSLFFASASVFAAGPDMSSITGAVGFDTVVSAVLGVAGLLAVLFVTLRGAQFILNMIDDNRNTREEIEYQANKNRD